jgi:hypothetical protein
VHRLRRTKNSKTRRSCLLEGNAIPLAYIINLIWAKNSQSRVLHVGTSTVTDRLVGDGEFTEVVTGHLRLDLNGGEGLSVLYVSRRSSQTARATHVDTTDGSNHLGNNDHVSQVSLDHSGLLVRSGVLLGESELLDETHGLSLKSSLEPSSCSGVNELCTLVGSDRSIL